MPDPNQSQTYPQPTCTHKPEDFSQPSINAGQRKINYKLSEVDMKLVQALKSLRDAVQKLSNTTTADIVAANKAISEADELSWKVAEIIPPGCDPGSGPG